MPQQKIYNIKTTGCEMQDAECMMQSTKWWMDCPCSPPYLDSRFFQKPPACCSGIWTTACASCGRLANVLAGMQPTKLFKSVFWPGTRERAIICNRLDRRLRGDWKENTDCSSLCSWRSFSKAICGTDGTRRQQQYSQGRCLFHFRGSGLPLFSVSATAKRRRM